MAAAAAEGFKGASSRSAGNQSLPFVDVVVGIPCIATNKVARDFVRQAWQRFETNPTLQLKQRVVMRFLIGQMDSSVVSDTAREAREYGDILFLGSGDDVHFKVRDKLACHKRSDHFRHNFAVYLHPGRRPDPHGL
jgi:hypothetical protein